MRLSADSGLVLITGGAGFVATNLADRLLSEGRPALRLDNLSRPGVERNVDWLRARHGSLVSDGPRCTTGWTAPNPSSPKRRRSRLVAGDARLLKLPPVRAGRLTPT